MSKSQIFRGLMSERLAAAAEDASALYDRMTTEYEEELRRSEQENDRKQRLLDRLLNPRVLLHRVAPCPGLNHDFIETLPIKSQPEEESGAKEQLPEPVPESSAVCQNRHQKETHVDSEGLTEQSDDTDNAEMETEGDNQAQDRKRSTKRSPQNNSAPGTSATVHKRDKTGPDGGERKKHKCSVCAKTFRRKEHLNVHTRVHTGEKPFKCSVCRKTFSQKNHLLSHRRTHTGEKPYCCTICNKAFPHLSTLKDHRRTHTGEKPFFCTVCHKAFSLLSTFKNHRRTHTGQKPYKCTVCDKAFAHVSTLKGHRRTHTGEKPFSCLICQKTFSIKGNLERHRKTHTGQKPYRCLVCEKTFTRKQNLKRHMSTHNI